MFIRYCFPTSYLIQVKRTFFCLLVTGEFNQLTTTQSIAIQERELADCAKIRIDFKIDLKVFPFRSSTNAMHSEYKFIYRKDSSARNISMCATSLHQYIYLMPPA